MTSPITPKLSTPQTPTHAPTTAPTPQDLDKTAAQLREALQPPPKKKTSDSPFALPKKKQAQTAGKQSAPADKAAPQPQMTGDTAHADEVASQPQMTGDTAHADEVAPQPQMAGDTAHADDVAPQPQMAGKTDKAAPQPQMAGKPPTQAKETAPQPQMKGEAAAQTQVEGEATAQPQNPQEEAMISSNLPPQQNPGRKEDATRSPEDDARIAAALNPQQASSASAPPPGQIAFPAPPPTSPSQPVSEYLDKVCQRIMVAHPQKGGEAPAIRLELNHSLLPDTQLVAQQGADGSFNLSFESTSPHAALLLNQNRQEFCEHLAQYTNQPVTLTLTNPDEPSAPPLVAHAQPNTDQADPDGSRRQPQTPIEEEDV